MPRMRKALMAFSIVFSLAAAGGCGGGSNKGSMDMGATQPDMTMVGPDMAKAVPNGVACGSATCAVGQQCCISADSMGNVTGEACQAQGTSCSGSVVSCDGTEDCSTAASPYCCANIDLQASTEDGGLPTFAGGGAMCTASCGLNYDQNAGAITTRLCHTNSDCAGETIPIIGGDTTCCSSTTTPGLHFCASSALAAVGLPVTCP